MHVPDAARMKKIQFYVKFGLDIFGYGIDTVA